MKDIGTTPQGNRIVEMSREEWACIRQLETSFLGNSQWDFGGSSLSGVDLSPVFEALAKLASAKSSIYKLQEYINGLASAFGGYKKGE